MGHQAERAGTLRSACVVALVAGTVMGVPGWMVGAGSPLGIRSAMGQNAQPTPEEDISQYTPEMLFELEAHDPERFAVMMQDLEERNPRMANSVRQRLEAYRTMLSRQEEAARRNAAGMDDARALLGNQGGNMVAPEGRALDVRQDDDANANMVGVGGGEIELNYAEPMDLMEFAGYVAVTLDKNIFVDDSLTGQTVVFQAPVKVHPDQLLTLLSALVEERGYALTADPLGWYSIIPAQQGVGVDMMGDALATTRIIPTPLVRPSLLVNTIQTTFQQGGGQAVRIAPVDDIGALIVTASPRTMMQVEAMVERIVSEMRQMKLRRLQLNFVSADYALTRILEINGRLGGGLGGVVGGGQGNPGVGAASAGSLTSLDSRLFVDQGNALLFKGTQDEYDQLGELIEMIDQISPLISRRYTAGTVVEDVVRAAEREGLGPVSYSVASSSPGGFATNAFGNNRNIGGNQFGGFANQQQATYGSGFTVDVQTGSFVYHGTDPQHSRVEQLVKEFSEQAIRDKIEIRAYKLHHADPEAVADILSQLIDRQQQAGGTFFPQTASQRNDLITPEFGDASAEGEGGFTVSAEETTVVADLGNAQVMVRARARDHEQISDVIDSLDQRRPQVAIRAKIISVTVRDSFDWTADVQINSGQWSFLSSFGLTTGPAGDLPGTRTVANNLRGATTALIRSDFLPIAINALKTVGDTRVMSSPQIVVNDNTEGSVRSEREEPFSSSSQGDGGIITSQGGVATAGTTLTVTPQISEGGYLKLEYTFELSEFDQTAAAGGGLQPPSQSEEYESTVTIPSGSTVVVGGFVLERDSESDNMVPILGEIPGLGALFKDYSKSKTRTMIFVFITPEILTDQNFVDLRLIGENSMEMIGEGKAFRDFSPIRMPVKGSVGPAQNTPTVWE